MHATTSESTPIDLHPGVSIAQRILKNVGSVLTGKQAVVELAVATLLSRGHLLLEDVPGVGKTTLARALSASVGLHFNRLQFTSDLMPADVLGGNVFSPASGEFSFRRGPVFTHVLLADEINRTTPKTQSALLEAMDERRVSIDGQTYDLDDPFFVLATQNPEEFYGTFPLPESQLDRFLMRLRLGYAAPDVEREILRRKSADPVSQLRTVVSRDELNQAQDAVDAVRSQDDVIDYLHALVLLSRESPLIAIGVSTRGAIAFERATRAYAVVQGRMYTTPDDVKAVAVATLAHRVRLTGSHDGAAAHNDAERVIRELLQTVAVPV